MCHYYRPLYSHVRRLYSALIFCVYICAFLVTCLYPAVSIYYTSVSARFYLRIVFMFVSVVYIMRLYLRVCISTFILTHCIYASDVPVD